ncbi:MAG: glycosyltransferase [Phycisphaerae bacterium]|nr:glycosyltransferase [Phycisphaerae bacterium]
MRFLTTTMCYPTPADPDQGIFVQRRALALARCAGVDVRVVAPQLWCPGLRASRSFPDQAGPLPVAYPRMISVPGLSWVCDGLAYARALERAIVVERQRSGHDFDLIDAHFEYPDGVGAWLAGRRLGLPVAVTVRGKIVSLSRRAIRRMQIGAMLRGVDALIAVSASLAAWIHKIGGSDLSVNIIPNGIDEAIFHPMNQADAKSRLGWDARVRYVLAVGHLQRVKGFDLLVEVLPGVRRAMGDVRLVLAGSRRGEPRFRARLERAITRINASQGGAPSIQFTGPVSGTQLNLMYNAADLFVTASRSEGWSNAISEALAAGTPVVATDVGGNREQICSEEMGTLVSGGDLNALRKAMVNALSKEWNRAVIAAHGRRRTHDRVAEEVLAVFKRILASPSSSTAAAGRDVETAPPPGRGASTVEVPA